MQRLISGTTLATRAAALARSSCDVFINHRGADTKKTVAGLLYDRLLHLHLRPFLDCQSMEPGDKLFQSIGSAIRGCKVGVVVFSPRYCESYFCLHELALLVETRKKLVPIFCDVKPSDLEVIDRPDCPLKEMQRFRRALLEARYTVGLTFDSQSGNWSDLVRKASEIVVKGINEEQKKRNVVQRKHQPHLH